MEAKEIITKGEESFERWRRRVGLVLGPIVFISVYFLPMESLSEPAHKLFAVVCFVLVFWLSEAVPLAVTAILGAVLNVLIGVAPAKVVLAPFANPLVFLFIGSFIIAESIICHGLDKRFAFRILSIRALQGSPMRVLFAFGLIAAVASMWISNTASAAMMLPIALGILATMKDIHSKGGESKFDHERFSMAMMLMVAYGASVGGIATPIGTPPNIIGIGMIEELAGVRITFFEWMTFALPITACMFLYLFIVLGKLENFGSSKLEGIGDYVKVGRSKLGTWSRGEINTAIAFGTVVLLWLLPSISALIYGKEASVSLLLKSRLNSGVVAMMGAIMLFLLPVSFKEWRFTMTWDRAVRIDWGTILLFGGGISLGTLMFSTGLAEALGTALTSSTGASGLWTVTAVGTIIAIVMSEATSNTASANMVIPFMIAIAQSLNLPVLPPALGACLGASFGFMLPVSTPPNAIVYGSGMIPILKMVRKGILFDIGGFIIIMIGLMVLCPLLGLV